MTGNNTRKFKGSGPYDNSWYDYSSFDGRIDCYSVQTLMILFYTLVISKIVSIDILFTKGKVCADILKLNMNYF